MASLLWLQGGACSGNTMSFLNAEEPSACDLVTDFGIDVLWHPSLGMDMGDNVQNMLREITSGKKELDIFVFEGTVIMGPNGSGRFNMFADRPMKDWVSELASQANAVVALGDCACWGGIPANAPNPTRQCRASVPETESRRISGCRFQIEMGLAGDQHSWLSLPSRLGHADSGCHCFAVEPATSRWTICSDRKPFSRRSLRPVAPEFSFSSTSNRRSNSARGPEPDACFTNLAAEVR